MTRLRVEALDDAGQGRGLLDTHPVAIAGALPGEVVDIELLPERRSGEARRGRLQAILEPSPKRIAPPCRHFGTCGGCAMQHLADRDYLLWKNDCIRQALGREDPTLLPKRIGAWVRTPPGQRRRVDLSFETSGAACILGLNERASHRIVDLEECPILLPELVALFDPLRHLLRSLQLRSGEIVMNRLDGGVDLLLLPQASWQPDLDARRAVADFAQAHGLLRIACGPRERPETLVQRAATRLASLGVAVDVPPGAFLQASQPAERAMQEAVRGWAQGARRIVDLYGGLGTLSLPLLQDARVHIVEGDAQAVAAVDAGLRRDGKLGRATIERRDLARDPYAADELLDFDLAILDPPRVGASLQAAALAASRIERVIAVSCNPRSFARDMRILAASGFELTELIPIDQFLWSAHIELIALCVRRRQAMAPVRSSGPRSGPRKRRLQSAGALG